MALELKVLKEYEVDVWIFVVSPETDPTEAGPTNESVSEVVGATT
jgi:hypothetical protein